MPDIDPSKLPAHVAVIMDGNGRWAEARGLSRVEGHREGAGSVRAVTRTSRELNIRWLSLYAFSEENWQRPRSEVRALMNLLLEYLDGEREEMLENGIRLKTIGQLDRLPGKVRRKIAEVEAGTAHGKDMTVMLCLSYGGRSELVAAARALCRDAIKERLKPSKITEDMLSSYLYTAGVPDPDLLIRTSGEMRISNFLLWQMAYTEFYFTPVLWPDFREEQYLAALTEYQDRERRFGRTGGQLAEDGGLP